jgi:hypothetical protein
MFPILKGLQEARELSTCSNCIRQSANFNVGFGYRQEWSARHGGVGGVGSVGA